MATKKTKGRAVIVGHGNWGLVYGRISASDAEIVKAKAVRVSACRHIAHWKGDPGGITSLAATGPRAGSRIGKPTASALVVDVHAVWDVSDEAVRAFDAMPASGDGSGSGSGDGSGDGSGYGSGYG